MKRADYAAYVGVAISLYGFLALNFMNFGSIPFLGQFNATFGWFYLHSLNLLFPYENWNFGLFAGVYFMVFLLCFMFLNRHLRFVENFRSTVAVCSAVVLLTEFGIYLSQPWFLNVYVISAQAETALSWFTNLDFMAVALSSLLLASVPARSFAKARDLLGSV